MSASLSPASRAFGLLAALMLVVTALMQYSIYHDVSSDTVYVKEIHRGTKDDFVTSVAGAGCNNVTTPPFFGPELLYLDELDLDTLWLPEETGVGREGGEGHTVAFLARNVTPGEAGDTVDEVLRRYPSYLVQSEPLLDDTLVLFVLRERTNSVTDLWRRLRDLHQPRDPRTCNQPGVMQTHAKFKAWSNGWGSNMQQALGVAAHSLMTGATGCMYNWVVGGNDGRFVGQFWTFAYDTCELRSQGERFEQPVVLLSPLRVSMSEGPWDA